MARWTLLDRLLERLRWRVRIVFAALTIKPVRGAEGDPEPKKEPEPEPDPKDEPEPDPKDEPDWKTQSRKHERRAKAERTRAEELQAELEKVREGNQSEQEKALTKAKKEARDEALAEAEKERRKDRLEIAVSKRARDLHVDEVLLNVEHAIAAGDIAEADIYDNDGRIDSDALKKELDALLERKPHLKANNGGRPAGDGDGGKGSGGGATSFNDVLRQKANL